MATFAVERFPVIGDRRFKLGAAMPAEVPQLGSGHALPSEARNCPALARAGDLATPP